MLIINNDRHLIKPKLVISYYWLTTAVCHDEAYLGIFISTYNIICFFCKSQYIIRNLVFFLRLNAYFNRYKVWEIESWEMIHRLNFFFFRNIWWTKLIIINQFQLSAEKLDKIGSKWHYLHKLIKNKLYSVKCSWLYVLDTPIIFIACPNTLLIVEIQLFSLSDF